MNKPIRTERPFWQSWPTFWYLCATAGFVLGAVVVLI